MDECLPFSECRHMKIIKETSEFSANNYNPLPVVLERGEGVWVWDTDGNKYLDAFSAYSVNNSGHRHPKIIAVLLKQLEKIAFTSNTVYTANRGEACRKIAELCGMDKVLLMNSGSEAVETAIKIARKWGYKVKGVAAGKAEIIVCHNNFHGRPTTIISFSDVEQYRDGFGPFTPGFKLIPFGDAKALSRAITKNTVAFLVEPIQGEGGINVPPEGYLRKAKAICKDSNVLLALDEIQTGMGRTGKNFAYEHERIKPNMVIMGKALGGGFLPISAVATKNEVMRVIEPGNHGSTFGGNPLACAVAIEAIKVLVEENLASEAAIKGERLMSRLRAISSPHVKEVRGKGLFIGMELREGNARDFCERLLKKGVLTSYARERVVRFSPPLTATFEELDICVEAVKKTLETY